MFTCHVNLWYDGSTSQWHSFHCKHFAPMASQLFADDSNTLNICQRLLPYRGKIGILREICT